MGEFYRIPADNRDLNYNKYFAEGNKSIELCEDYNSHNTKRCSIDEIKKLLYDLPIIKEALNS